MLLNVVVDDFGGDHGFVFAVNICKVADGKVDLFLATVSDVELRALLARESHVSLQALH